MARKVNIKIEGADKIIQAFGKMEGGAVGVMMEAVKDAGDIVETDMQSRADKIRKTGNLEGEIAIRSQYEQKKDGKAIAYIGPGKDVDYAFFVEVGTKDTKASPYARPAVDKNRKKIKEAIENKIADTLERLWSSGI